jgi:nicotinamide-nucleotide amidase
MKAIIISIGNELLIGQVINTNAAWLGEKLTEAGISVISHQSIGDEKEAITAGLTAAFERAELVITTGGLGPTRDDITKVAIAAYFGKKMVFHQLTWDRIQEAFSKRNIPVSELHHMQCFMPEGFEILENDLGTAPGLKYVDGGKTIIILPGVPYEMKHIVESHILTALYTNAALDGFFQHTFHTAGTGETVIADKIRDFEDGLPEGYSIAYLPSIAQVRIRLTKKGKGSIDFEMYKLELKSLLEPWLFGENGSTLEEVIGDLLRDKKLKMVTAESCTGGAIAARIVQLPGASEFFEGGFVSYSNGQKTRMLDVVPDTLNKFGAVSSETIREMILGAVKKSGADVAVAVSGIAGPDGGTTDKPVGTIWIGVGNGSKQVIHKYYYQKDRQRNIEFTTNMALIMLRKFLIAHDLS